MKIERKKNRDTTTIIIEGELTIYQVSLAKQEMFTEHEKYTSKIAVDLQQVTEIDTAGVQLLLFAKIFFSGLDKTFYITRLNESVETVLTALNLNHQLTH